MASNYEDPRLFAPDSAPFGISFADWTAKWWQWLLEQPRKGNPALDRTGEDAANGQNDHNVWFLAGSFDGSVERSCTIPAARAILFPVINFYALIRDLKYEHELSLDVKEEMDKITNMNVTVDGVPVNELGKYRVESPRFSVKLPRDNVSGVKDLLGKPIDAYSKSDGYWLFLKPLSSGKHEVHSFGSCRAGAIRIEVHYHLLVA